MFYSDERFDLTYQINQQATEIRVTMECTITFNDILLRQKKDKVHNFIILMKVFSLYSALLDADGWLSTD